MRCLGCDKMMSESELGKINPHTGDYDDLCHSCRDLSWDGGLEFNIKEDKYAFELYKGLSEGEMIDIMRNRPGGLETDGQIIGHIKANGGISIENG